MSDVTVFDRRQVLAGAASFAATALLPSLIAAAPVESAVTGPERLTDWTIDDMFGLYPRYSQAIGYGRPSREPALAAADPLERLFFA
jgi:hypothetical protein